MIVEWLSFIALISYVYLTYLLVKDKYNPLVTFYLTQQEEVFDIGFHMVNGSRAEVEVFGKVWCDIKGHRFEFKKNFYGDKKHWILQPNTKSFGHFSFLTLKNEEGKTLNDFVKQNNVKKIYLNAQIIYRGTKRIFFRKKWIKTSPLKYAFNFEKNLLYLDV